MGERIKKNTVLSCLIIFGILILVHGLEAIVVRTDETILGENFINKIFGIIIIFIVLDLLKWRPGDIGFKGEKIRRSLGFGVFLGLATYIVAYCIEIIILRSRGSDVSFGLFTTGFSLTGETTMHAGIGFVLLCIVFNVINVIMEEGAFRGLFNRLIRLDHSPKYALLFQALLFGMWHIVTPLHNLVDKDIDFGAFVGLSVGYFILAGLMAIKWGLLYRMTGNLYTGMADHFFNNCVGTNLLHVITDGGVDELMIVRVVIAQLLSFALVLAISRKTKGNPDF
ncbi:MAG: CPBP family intramembrane metalloprotease [Butyrivibrio sp.]|nr:CPBP family intramembrane metalloprotease [Butyrivibrio sp.]